MNEKLKDIQPEPVNFSLSLIVGTNKSSKGILELGIEVAASIEGGSEVGVHADSFCNQTLKLGLQKSAWTEYSDLIQL